MMRGTNDEKLKKVELGLLSSFIECCNKLGVSYYLVGGTLIGAVRHKGFIPWDDDIDVGMMRKDYDVFVNEGQRYLPDYYFIQTRKTDPEYLLNFAKIRDSRTTFIETNQKKRKINHGIYIDVFAFDNYPDNISDAKALERKLRILSTRVNNEFTLEKAELGSFVKRNLRSTIANLIKIRYPDVSVALDDMDALYRTVPEGKQITNYCGAWGKKEIIPREWFKKGIKASFEGLEAMIPAEYDKYLTHVYGDYMTLPPIEKRVSHHFTEVIDPDRSYIEYI